jgi:hypothetical protein
MTIAHICSLQPLLGGCNEYSCHLELNEVALDKSNEALFFCSM